MTDAIRDIVASMIAGLCIFYGLTCWDLIRENEVDKRVLAGSSVAMFSVAALMIGTM